jgi:hypothetical protein
VSPERVVLAPPEPWDEERLLAAARALPETLPRVEVGDAVGDLLVVAVESAPTDSLEITPRALPHGTRTVDLVVLVDAGASMAERWSAQHTRAQAAHEALAALLKAPPARVATVQVLAFAATLHDALPTTPARNASAPALPAPRGKARAGTALQLTLARIAATAQDRAREIVLVTDGPSEPALLVEAASRAGRLGVPVHVVVFAPAEDPTLREVARRSRGTIQRASLPLTIEFPEESS